MRLCEQCEAELDEEDCDVCFSCLCADAIVAEDLAASFVSHDETPPTDEELEWNEKARERLQRKPEI